MKSLKYRGRIFYFLTKDDDVLDMLDLMEKAFDVLELIGMVLDVLEPLGMVLMCLN